jgi:hypothetical protein
VNRFATRVAKVLCNSTAKTTILADTSKTLSASHSGAPHAATSTEEELAIAVRTAKTRQLRNIGGLCLDHAGTLWKTLERAPGIAYVLRSATANAIDRADARVSVVEGRRVTLREIQSGV